MHLKNYIAVFERTFVTVFLKDISDSTSIRNYYNTFSSGQYSLEYHIKYKSLLIELLYFFKGSLVMLIIRDISGTNESYIL